MKGALCVVLFFTFMLATIQQVPLPLPKKYHGHQFGNISATIQLEIFLNIPCPYTKMFWQGAGRYIMKEYVQTGKMNFIVHQFPLPYIIASFESSKSVYVVEKYKKNKLLEYIDYSIMNGEIIGSGRVINKTGLEIRNLIFSTYSSKFGITRDQFEKEMSGSEIAILQRDGLNYFISHIFSLEVWCSKRCIRNSSFLD
jgi:hypothetical protein